MKILICILLFVLSGISVYSQTEAKVIAEVAASSERTIKNAPFSAEAVSESIQVLADGNRIVRSSTSKLYRNSEGQFRREVNGGSGGFFGSTYLFGSGVTILDPLENQRYILDVQGKTARVVELAPTRELTVISGTGFGANAMTAQQRAEVETRITSARDRSDEEKLRTRAAIARGTGVSGGVTAGGTGTYTIAPMAQGGFLGAGQSIKYDTRTEDLGTRDFEGVSAEGTKIITTIPAGAIGNERPIEITYERWYSKELELVVYSKQNDPRFGEQTYKLTGISRTEPAPSLFSVPAGYRLFSEPATIYKVRAPKIVSGTVVAPAKPVTAPKPQ